MVLIHPLSARTVEDFEIIPTEEIEGENEALYDSWDEDLRNRIDSLEDFPLLDENGNEKRVYDPNGKRVLRRYPLINYTKPPCGVLLNLLTCEALFVLDPSMLDDGQEPIRVSLYPQAYLRKIGHMQASSILPDFQEIVDKINKKVTRERNDEDENEDDEDFVLRRPALTGVKFQAYNEMVHRWTDRHGGMDVQQGALTAAAAGRYARSTKDAAAATRTAASVSGLLPHHKMAQKLSNGECPRDLRLEQVYILDLNLLPAEHRNGR